MTAVGITWRLLIAAEPFTKQLDGRRVGSAIASGLADSGLPEPDVCVLDGEGETSGVGQRSPARGAGEQRRRGGAADMLASIDFDVRMREARAVVIATSRLDERTLLGSVCFEVATRARQAGVPAYAITAVDEIDRFDARILDLQAVLLARGARSLRTAGRKLAEIV